MHLLINVLYFSVDKQEKNIDETKIDVSENNEKKEDNDHESIIKQLEHKIFELKMNQEAERKVFVQRLTQMRTESDNMCKDIRHRLERQNKDAIQIAIRDFIVKNVLQVCDALREMIINFETINPGVAQSAVFICKRVTNTLNNHGFEEISVKPGDAYDSEIHNVLDVFESEEVEEDCVDKVYCHAWTMTSGDKIETVRCADVRIAKKKK